MDRFRTALAAASLALLLPLGAAGHTPSVAAGDHTSPETALVLDDPTLSRAIGSIIREPGEVHWYVKELAAGDPLVVGITAPEATGSLAATFVVLGPGLPDAGAAGEPAAGLAAEVGAEGALAFEPWAEPVRETHGGLPFLDYGGISTDAPADGTYWIVVRASEPGATGKYVLAPGVREEFGIDAIGGMVDLVGLFEAPWPAPEDDTGAEDAGVP
jgi:hypothetical protein